MSIRDCDKEVYEMLLIIAILFLLAPVIAAVVIALVRKHFTDYRNEYDRRSDQQKQYDDEVQAREARMSNPNNRRGFR